jgi:DNA polymerase III subunit delta'
MPLIGQANAETLLARAVQRGRVGHAYLFLGPAGVGKSTAAKLFAQAINCETQPAVAAPPLSALHPPPSTLHLAPCGQCASCRRIAAGTHPEVIEVRPGSKTGQDVTVDQIREIRKNAALRPKLGSRRVYLFPQGEAVNETSANALLKTLEEPSPFVVLVLCAPSPSHMLPTIQSRCQTVRFNLARPEEVARHLTAGGTTPQIADELARACGGRPGLAIGWAQSPSVLKSRRAVLDLFYQALDAARSAARTPSLGVLSLRLAEQLRGLAVQEDGDTRPAKALHQDNLEIGLCYLRDLLLLASGADTSLVQNQDRLSELTDLARTADEQRVLADLQTVRQSQQILERNVQPQPTLERMFWALISGPVPLPQGLFEEIGM